jgi:hypothetical protein
MEKIVAKIQDASMFSPPTIGETEGVCRRKRGRKMKEKNSLSDLSN